MTRDRYGAVHYAKDVDEGSETVCLDFNDQAHFFFYGVRRHFHKQVLVWIAVLFKMWQTWNQWRWYKTHGGENWIQGWKKFLEAESYLVGFKIMHKRQKKDLCWFCLQVDRLFGAFDGRVCSGLHSSRSFLTRFLTFSKTWIIHNRHTAHSQPSFYLLLSKCCPHYS